MRFNNDSLQQLALFYASAQAQAQAPPKSLLDQFEAATEEEELVDANVAQDQQLVSRILTQLNIEHSTEVSPFEKGNLAIRAPTILNIDFVISNDVEDKKVAVEFNGPNHYMRSEGINVEGGRTKFKRRLLEGLGYTVVSINWNEWRKAKDTGTEEDYLRNLLNIDI